MGIVASFWDDIKNWLHSLVYKVREIADRVVLGAKIFIKKMKEGYQEFVEVWQQDKQGQFYKMTETKQVPESEVPPEIRAKASRNNDKVDITNDLKEELNLIL